MLTAFVSVYVFDIKGVYTSVYTLTLTSFLIFTGQTNVIVNAFIFVTHADKLTIFTAPRAGEIFE